MSNPNQQPKEVFAIIERGNDHRSIWIKVGVAFINRDGSLNIRLHAVPLTGLLQVRERRQEQRQAKSEPNRDHYRGNGGSDQHQDDYPF